MNCEKFKKILYNFALYGGTAGMAYGGIVEYNPEIFLFSAMTMFYGLNGFNGLKIVEANQRISELEKKLKE